MEPTDITIRLLQEIRDAVLTSNERLEQVEDRLQSLERTTAERLDRHEKALGQLVAGQARHEKALGLLIDEMRSLGSRIDNIMTGPLGEKVRELDRRVTALESRPEP